MTPLRTTCPYCGVGCGVSIVDGRPQGDIDHPANAGRLCSKGAALGETLDLPGRLLRPVVHGRETGWDEALDVIAAAFTRIRETAGPDAIALYVSGQFLTEDYYVANKLMKGFIGSTNIDTNSRLCMSSSVAGHVRAFGEDVVPGCYEDLDEADLAVLVGSNMAWCHPVLHQRLMAARDARGTQIVAIDPRRTATATAADLHLPVKPGADVALFSGLLVHLADTGQVDRDWIDAHVSGFDEALAAAQRIAPDLAAVAASTDLPSKDIEAFYHLFARTRRSVTLYSQGVNQSVAGADKVNAILNCHLATARIGRPGMGPFSLTGQPNAMGGREVGGLANQLAAHMSFTSEDTERVGRFWNAPRMATRPGYTAVDLFRAVEDGRVQAVWIAATNPAVSMPDAGRVREALARCPLVIVSDAWPTDTTEFADVILPAASWAEKDGTVTNSERRISRQRAFRPAPGEAKPDWWMFAEVARRMGWAGQFAYDGPADIFREHAALSAFENDGSRLFDIGGLADLDARGYACLEPIRWPCRRDGFSASARLFAGGTFPTADGRGRMVPLASASPGQQKGRSLTLNTGRVRDQWHTMTRTGLVPRLMAHTPGPSLTICPADAEARGIVDGGLVRIESEQGSVVLRAVVDDGLRPGDVFAPMHWSDQFCSSGPVDRLVHPLTDPVSGQPDLKGTGVEVYAEAEAWRGLLVRRHGSAPTLQDGVYWSCSPIDGGRRWELSGTAPLPEAADIAALARRLMGLPDEAELASYTDTRKSVFRFAGLLEGTLDACLFIAVPGTPPPDTARAERLLGQEVDGPARLSLLAGLEGAARPAGKTVCSCFSVGEAEILEVATARGIRTTAQLGDALGAGTNCGSCLPELRKLLGNCAGSRPEAA
ncbi:MAG: molybdopterin-dependent oxidoreductase [Alphaproteobacteria bacterium]|nr:molybdopterin-dependent oxidoreductase [Alphaproteobacteria bacterium]